MENKIQYRHLCEKIYIQIKVFFRWFQGFDWNALIAETMTAPIKNSVKHSHDTSNFDRYIEEEEENAQDELSGWDENF